MGHFDWDTWNSHTHPMTPSFSLPCYYLKWQRNRTRVIKQTHSTAVMQIVTATPRFLLHKLFRKHFLFFSDTWPSIHRHICLHSLTQLKLGQFCCCLYCSMMANFMRKGSLFAKKFAVDLNDVVDVFTHRFHDCAALLSRCGHLYTGCLINEGRFLRCLIDGNDSQFRR